MIERFILLLLLCSSALIGFSQKRDKKTKEKNTFQYYYKCEAKDYIQTDNYHFELKELNKDSLILSGDGGANFIRGTISYSQDLNSGEIKTEDGKFVLKIPKLKSTSPFLIELNFEDHETNDLWLNWSNDVPREFFLETPRKSIFDPESPYVIVYSKKELSKTELTELIDCLGKTRNTTNNCYDKSFIQIHIPF